MKDVKSVSIFKNLGRYNLASNEKSWCVEIVAMFADENIAVSETWDADDEPDTYGLPPSEVLELISSRVESYWISTARDKQRKKINSLREHSGRLDDAWARGMIESLNKRIKSLRQYLLDEQEAA